MSPRRLNFYGHFRRGAQAKRAALRAKVEAAHAAAIREDRERTR